MLAAGPDAVRHRRNTSFGTEAFDETRFATYRDGTRARLNMWHDLHHEAVFRTPLAEVFDFITTTGHWPEWHPATHAVTGKTLEPARLGDECDEAMLTAHVFRGHISWRVVTCEAPVNWEIVSTTIAVPLLSRARVRVKYVLEKHGLGTRLLRTFSYAVPPYLWLFDRLYLRSKMESESVAALRCLVPLVDGARPQRTSHHDRP